MAIAIATTIQIVDIFVQISKGFGQNGIHLSGFQMVGFRISDPIQNRNHLQPNLFLKSRLVQILDPHCLIDPNT